MSDQAATERTERFHILRGPDRAIYMLSEANLDQHRVPDEIVPTLLEAYAAQIEESEREGQRLGSFKVLASGSFSKKQFGMVPTDHWIDTM